MKPLTPLIASIAALTLGGAAHAAPLGSSLDIDHARATGGQIENVAYRRCWYDDGGRFCKTYYQIDDDYYDGGYYGFPIIGGWGGGGFFGRGHFGGGHFGGGHGGGHGGHGRR